MGAVSVKSEKTPLKIMVIEDDELYRSIISEMLKGHEVEFASNAEQAIEIFKDKKPQLVFLDINLPDASGHQVLKELFSIYPDVFVVMLTGSNLQKDVKQSLDLGARGYIVKPFTKVQILTVIDQYYVVKNHA